MDRRQFLLAATSGVALAGGALSRANPMVEGLRALGDRAGLQISASVAARTPWTHPPLPDDWAIPELERIMRADLHAIQMCDASPAAMLRWRNKPRHPADLFVGSDGPERSFAYAKEAGLGLVTFQGIWQEEWPEWLPTAPDRKTAIAEMRAYLAALAQFKGQTLWHRAVNECIDFWHGGGINYITTKRRSGAPNVYYQKIGPDYPEITFQILRELDPKAKLVLNQYGLWETGYGGAYDRARAWTLQTIDRFHAKNIPIDYLGIQCHLAPGHPAIRFDEKRFARFIERVAARGVEVLLTELDSQDGFLADKDVAVRDAKCAAEAKRILDVALAHKVVKGINLARLTEWRSYFEGDFDRPASTASGAKTRAFPYDEQFRKKPMWDAIASALRARAS